MKKEQSEVQSLHLKQHLNQLVNWQLFTNTTLNQAQKESKPVFISIGYSTSHLCQLMNRETFNNHQIANYLNENFTCIKVDRDIYPDIDKHYQQASQLISSSSGWPLNVFAFPDLKPFFIGGYYTRSKDGQEHEFFQLLKELIRLFNEDKSKLRQTSNDISNQLNKGFISNEKIEFEGHFPHPMSILNVTSDLMDLENGGYGNEPKFTQFSYFNWACEQILEGIIEEKEKNFIVNTINNILAGSISDQARGGIHTLSFTKDWNTPKFEKLLFNQAEFLSMLAKFSLIESYPIVFDAIYNTLDYLEKEMFDEEKKYFFSSQNSESEEINGLFFIFSQSEFQDALKDAQKNNLNLKIEDNLQNILKWFDIKSEGSFHGMNTIHLSIENFDQYKEESSWKIIRSIRKELINQRSTRIPPITDSKGIASWNFLISSSLIDIIQYCPIEQIKQKATQLLNLTVTGCFENFVQISSEKNQTIIKHINNISENTILYFEDYVFFAENQLRLSEITANPTFLQNFKDTINFIINNFKIDQFNFLSAINTPKEILDYPRTLSDYFDYNYKSPLSTFALLLRKYKIVFNSKEHNDLYSNLKEDIINKSLKDPINAGQALRAFSYPDEVMKTITVPSTWLEETIFLQSLAYFLHRFTILYHQDKNDLFQICHEGKIEIEGHGLQEFKTKLFS